MERGYLVGCDIGTGGTKAVVIDTDGRVYGSHYIEYGMRTPRPGWAEQDPELYWSTVADTIRIALAQSGISSRDVRAVGLSAHSPACVAVDERGNALRWADFWMDRRGTAEADFIRATLGEQRVFALSGNPIDPYYGVVKWLWLKNHEPHLYDRTVTFLNQKDYPLLKLTGRAVTDYSNAALDGICFDIVNRRWDMPTVAQLGLDPAKLPVPLPCDEVVGGVTAAAAARTGLREGTPVVAGTVDANAAWLSMGVIDDGENALTLGTAACWGLAHDAPRFTPGMITLPHAASSRTKYFTAAALVAGGALMRWFRDTFGHLERETGAQLGLSPYDIMNLEAERAPPGCDGLLVLPYFMGERTPIWDTEARGVLFGLNLGHTRGHIVRAMMEGVAFGIAHNVELVRQHVPNVSRTMGIVEGGANSALWRQIMSDVLNVEAVYMPSVRGAPLGDAVIAGVGVGAFKDYYVVKDWLERGVRHQPDPAHTAFYGRLARLYRDLYPALRPHFAELAQISDWSNRGQESGVRSQEAQRVASDS